MVRPVMKPRRFMVDAMLVRHGSVHKVRSGSAYVGEPETSCGGPHAHVRRARARWRRQVARRHLHHQKPAFRMHVRYAAWYAGSFAPSGSIPVSCGSSDFTPSPVPGFRASAARLWSLVFGRADSAEPFPARTARCASTLQAVMSSALGTSGY